MNDRIIRRTVLLMMTGIVCAASFTVYGLTSGSSNKVDAIASATTAPTKPVVKPVAPPPTTQPKTTPVPVPVPAPIAPVTPLPAVKETTLNLIVYGKSVNLSDTPIVLTTDGKTMLPLRKLGEALGYSVKWDDTIKAAVLQKNNEIITVKRNSLEYTWGALPRLFSKTPEMVSNRLYVPLDFITSNPSLQLNQTATSLSVDLTGAVSKQAITGEIKDITVFSNGLGLTVTDNKDLSLLLYVTDETKITNYSAGTRIERNSLKKGTKAIFTFTVVAGDDKKSYNVLGSIEVVEQPVPATAPPSSTFDDDNDDDDEEDDD